MTLGIPHTAIKQSVNNRALAIQGLSHDDYIRIVSWTGEEMSMSSNDPDFSYIPILVNDTGHTLMTVIKSEKYLSANKKKSKSKPTRTSKDLLQKRLLPSNVKDDNDNDNTSRDQHDDQPPAKCAKTIPEQRPAAPDSDIEELPAPHRSTTRQPSCTPPPLHHTLDQTPLPPPHDTCRRADLARRPHDLLPIPQVDRPPIPQVDATAMMQKMFKQQQQQMQQQMQQQFAQMAKVYGFAPNNSRDSSRSHTPANAIAGPSRHQHSHNNYSDDEQYNHGRYQRHGRHD
ncbi:hypothetical protein DXG01_011633 [Tephrocybe rancida]|nr:hypothetical protein DXG01_011633 [Tephrocybe rancida]